MKSRAAFTLIEIMIVVAIVAILAFVAIPNFIAYLHTSRVNLCISNIQVMNEAVEAYLIEHPGSENSISLSDIAPVDGATTQSGAKYLLKKEPKCPAGGVYSYDPVKHTWVCSRDSEE